MTLPVQQAREIFTKAYLASYKENIPVPSFLRTFFSVLTFVTKSISIEVQRGTERIAVDVLRGVDGNRNTFSRSSEKEFVPPFYNENFDATQLDRYDRVFGQSFTDSPSVIGYLARDVSEKTMLLRDKIERAKELQCSQVLETGIVVLKNGDNIDYKRKAASKIDLTDDGGYWSSTGTDVEAQLVKGAEFIRQKGKNGVPTLNIIMSGSAWIALKKTDYFKTKANFNQVLLLDVNMPQKDSYGAGYMGRITSGAYIFNVWTYDETYEDSTGTTYRYWPLDKAVIIPTSGTRFHLSHAGVPAILADTRNAEYNQYIGQVAAEYYLNNYIDPQRKSHTFEIYSAPLAIPVSVDMIYTMKVLDGQVQQG